MKTPSLPTKDDLEESGRLSAAIDQNIIDIDGDGKISAAEKKIFIQNWVTRRKMAWIALFSMIVLMGFLLFGTIAETRIQILSDPITWFFFTMGSIVAAYFGFSAWSSKKSDD